jgi:hypothetical protein
MPFPTNPEDITADLLTEVLQPLQPGIVVTDFSIPVLNQCGDGHASTADRLLVSMTYAGAIPDDMPEEMMLKTMLISPHAPSVMYENEILFYRDIKPLIDQAGDFETPRVFAADFDPDSAQFGLMMEDLNKRNIIFPNATDLLSIAQVRGILRTLAKLHGFFWGDEGLQVKNPWLSTHVKGGMNDIFREHGFALVSDQVEKNPFKQDLISPLGVSLDDMWKSLTAFQDEVDQSYPKTLLHGDTHVGNIYLLPDSVQMPDECNGGLYDWQLTALGNWAHDVSYIMTTALTIEQRQQNEVELLKYYLEELSAQGIKDAPDWDDAWYLYRRSIMWGLFIGWLITPPSNYGEEITTANISKLVQANLDHESFRA